MSNQQGLTLLEILVGVSIFAISLSIAAGVFSGTSRYQQKAEVSRSIDENVRQTVEQISQDIRNSRGIVMVNSNNIYYNFVGLDNFQISQNEPNSKIEDSEVLLVSLDDSHRRQYYLQNESIMVQDIIYHSDNLSSGWRKDGQPQPISGENIIVSSFSFKVNTPWQSKQIDKSKLSQNNYPYVEIGFKADFDNKRDLPELKGEQVEVETIASPRNFSFID